MKALLLLTVCVLGNSPSWFDVPDLEVKPEVPCTTIPQKAPQQIEEIPTVEDKPSDWPDEQSDWPDEPKSETLYSFNELPDPVPQQQLVGLAPCPNCPGSRWQSLIPKNLRDNPNIVWQNKSMRGCPKYPAIYDPMTHMFYHGSSLKSPQTLESAIQFYAEAKGLYSSQDQTLGSIDKSIFREARYWLGSSGSLKLGNQLKTFDITSFLTVRVPANFAASWQSNGLETKITFSTKPSVRLKVVDQYISAITLTDDSAKLHVDWFPDYTFEGTGETLPPQSFSAPTRWSYPIRGNLYTHPNYIKSHLQEGEHRGKWSIEVLNDLIDIEAESLHSDHHDQLKGRGSVKPFIQVAK